MTLASKRGGAVSIGLAVVAASALAACAAPRDASADAPPLRVLVKLAQPSDDARAISAEASRIAGVPVSYAAAAGMAWHAIALHCAGAQCDAAIARLRAAGDRYQAVEIEGRKSRPAS